MPCSASAAGRPQQCQIQLPAPTLLSLCSDESRSSDLAGIVQQATNQALPSIPHIETQQALLSHPLRRRLHWRFAVRGVHLKILTFFFSSPDSCLSRQLRVSDVHCGETASSSVISGSVCAFDHCAGHGHSPVRNAPSVFNHRQADTVVVNQCRRVQNRRSRERREQCRYFPARCIARYPVQLESGRCGCFRLC